MGEPSQTERSAVGDQKAWAVIVLSIEGFEGDSGQLAHHILRQLDETGYQVVERPLDPAMCSNCGHPGYWHDCVSGQCYGQGCECRDRA